MGKKPISWKSLLKNLIMFIEWETYIFDLYSYISFLFPYLYIQGGGEMGGYLADCRNRKWLNPCQLRTSWTVYFKTKEIGQKSRERVMHEKQIRKLG